MAGRPKRPLALVRAEGNPGKRKLPTAAQEVSPDPSMPAPPFWLSDVAKQEWLRVVPILFKLGLMADLYTVPLGAYCQSYARYQEAEEKDQTAVSNVQLIHIERLCREFGMTPAASGKMSIPGHDDEDEMSKLLNVR